MNETRAGFAYVWEYIVRDDYVNEFRRVYGPGGEWVELFAQADGYVRTELHRDIDNRNRFLTIDYWVSRERRAQFREEFSAEFDDLDKACEELTVTERFVGDFQLE
jgi:quinol monooxygenase YgiN